jgi:hypothetical protein
MSTKFVCDKCGNEFNDRSKVRQVQYPDVAYHTSDIRSELTIEKFKDLCKDCLIKLGEWMKPDAKSK